MAKKHTPPTSAPASVAPSTGSQRTPPTDQPATAPVNGADPSADDALLAKVRLSQSYDDPALGVRPVLMTVPLRKPGKTEFVRVHPDHILDVFIVELKEERETFVVVPAVAQTIAEFAEPVRLRLTVTRQGMRLVWPLKLPREDRRGSDWHRSMAEAAQLAERKWIRVAPDMSLGAYQVFEAISDLGEPKWPSESWATILRIALRDKLIDGEDHPVIRQLLGRT